MKKYPIFLIALAIMAILSACSETKEKMNEFVPTPPEEIPFFDPGVKKTAKISVDFVEYSTSCQNEPVRTVGDVNLVYKVFKNINGKVNLNIFSSTERTKLTNLSTDEVFLGYFSTTENIYIGHIDELPLNHKVTLRMESPRPWGKKVWYFKLDLDITVNSLTDIKVNHNREELSCRII